MNLYADLMAWLKDNPPLDMPYFHGAPVTSPFGLRRTPKELDVASPAHLAPDRAHTDCHLVMPFDGSLYWRLTSGVAGSVLSLNPHGLPLEIQVFHTRNGTHTSEVSTPSMHKGDILPMAASNLGMSIKVGRQGTGKHTHTLLLFPYDEELHGWLRKGSAAIITNSAVEVDYVIRHCRRYNLLAPTMLEKLRTQIDDWGISEMTNRYAVCDGVPEYRRPEWGRGPVIYVNSMWLLKI